MLMYGKPNNIDFIDNAKIYNISGMREGFENLQILIPPNNIGMTYGRDFDINYYNYIMINNNVFIEFFRIVNDLYIGRNVYLIFDDGDWSENLCQSILKIIQQRYGYNGYLITCFNDYIYASMNDKSTFDTNYGLYNLDIDKERYRNLIQMLMGQFGEGAINKYV